MEGTGNGDELMIAQVYANDQLIQIKGSLVRRIEQKWALVWQACKEWERDSNTRYNFCWKDNWQVRASIVRLDDMQIATTALAQLQYLDLIIDKKLNLTKHKAS